MSSGVLEYHSGTFGVGSIERVLETESQNGISCTWSGQVVNGVKSIKYTWKFNWDELVKKGVEALHGHIMTRRTALSAAENVQIDVELTEVCDRIERIIDNVNQNTGPGVAFDYYLTPIYSKRVTHDELFAASEKTDVVLVVEGKKLHVNKVFLSFHSDFFTALFSSNFKEGQLTEIPIEDVSYEDFCLFLSVIYPHNVFPKDKTAEKLLELADRFLMPAVTRQVEHHLLEHSKLRNEKLMWLADAYGMPALLGKCIRSMDTMEKAKALEASPEYEKMSDGVKAKLFSRILQVN